MSVKMDIHRQSSSDNTSPFRLSTIQSKWTKTAFHTLSSNSCKRSTTSMRKKLKPVSPSLSKNAFYHSESECQFSRLDLKSHNMYCSWNNRLFFEKHFNLGSVNHIMLIIDQPPSRSDFLPSFFCILPGQDLTLQHVSFGGQVANPVLRDKALWTWAGTEVANVCD